MALAVLTYSNGVFTFRPADLSRYATTGSIANLIGYNDISVTQVGASGTGALLQQQHRRSGYSI